MLTKDIYPISVATSIRVPTLVNRAVTGSTPRLLDPAASRL
jgi:hypothetical protein